MSSAELLDPDDLNAEEERLLARLRVIDGSEYEKEVNRYLNCPTESWQIVMRHPDVVEKTNDALLRLQHRATTKLKRTSLSDRETRESVRQQIELYREERQAIRPYIGLAVAEAGRKSDRARAEQLTMRLRRDELAADVKFLEQCLREGMSTRQAEQAWREQRRGRAS